jgi:alpha-tubulin suppressor-like RCC1 family protein
VRISPLAELSRLSYTAAPLTSGNRIMTSKHAHRLLHTIGHAVLLLTLATACSPSASGTSPADSKSTSDTVSGDLGSTTTDAAESPDLPLDASSADNGSGGNCSAAGCACASNNDCDTGLCMEVNGKSECAKLCQSESGCPSDFACSAITTGGGDLVNVCTPRFNRLCEPCQADVDCSNVIGGGGNRCVAYKDAAGVLAGHFCSAPCGADDACPSGYSCQEVTSLGGAKGKQCLKSDQQCACDERATKLGLATSCSTANALGACQGKRACSATGLSACDAPAAETETCNLKDDNCNGQTDEPGAAVCPDNEACTYDNCVQGGCQHTPKVGACDDGSACTKDDACSDGKCKAAAVTCDDGDVCTEDGCDPASGCVVLSKASTCTDDNACTVGDACSGGACLPTGATVCDDANPCTTDACDPQKGCQFVDNSAPCDDGDACTYADACAGGGCKGKGFSCADGNPCTDDSCDPATGCAFLPNAASCTDGSACSIGDQCKGGVCLPGAATNCDDSNACTTDACDLATGCTYTLNEAPCSDGNACTTGDLCQGGACKAGDPLGCDDNNGCTYDTCDLAVGCTHTGNEEPCSDGNACTEGDLCKDGGCNSGAPLSCEDGNSCTDDYCDASVGCQHKNNQAACSDGTQCTTGDACVDGACQIGPKLDCFDGNVCTDDSCDPAKGCVFAANSAPCTDFNGCTTGDVCAAGVCKSGSGCGQNALCAPSGDGSVACVCAPGYVGDGKTCVGGCGNGQKSPQEACDDGNLSNGDGCSATCKLEPGWSCFGVAPSTCCGLGTFAGASSCLPCPTGCATCVDASACTSCPVGKLLSNGQCVSVCPAGTVPSNGVCKSCPVGCADCGNDGICTACQPGKVMHKGACLTTCPNGFWPNNGMCTACDSKCATCSDATTCTSCPAGKLLDNGDCIDCTPKGCGIACGAVPDGCGGTLQCGTCGNGDIAAGGGFTCGLLVNGQVKCWGGNNYGQLGDGSTTPRRQATYTTGSQAFVVDLASALQVTTGIAHACALLQNKTIACWGANTYGQLGDGSAASGVPRLKPVPVLGINNAVSVTAGRLHTCALLADGTAKCWGFNGTGQLGDGTTITRLVPVPVAGLANATQLSASWANTCAILAGGTMRCWGYNTEGGVGDNTTTNRLVPVPVVGITNAAELGMSSTSVTTCVRLADGTARCWGRNDNGQIGDNTLTDRKVPTPVLNLTNAKFLTAGIAHTCAVLTDGTMRCWGRNINGELGDTTLTSKKLPSVVYGVKDVIDAAAGDYHTCALLADQSVRCWGNNPLGQLGFETTLDSAYPSQVSGYPCGGAGTSKACGGCTPTTCQKAGKTSGVIPDGCGGTLLCGVDPPRVGGGTDFSCVVQTDGTVRCWGANDWGQLGDGTTVRRYQATFVNGNVAPVVGITTAVAVSTGSDHACALLQNGTIRCWGSNLYAQLGSTGGTDNLAHPEPMQVNGIANAVAVSAGRLHTCAVLATGGIKCWGYNATGQLGDGTTQLRALPVSINVAGIIDVQAGYSHTCALTQTGLVRCWGDGVEGQQGSGFTSVTYPHNVAYLNNVVALRSGSQARHTCALLADASVRCWGWNDNGQIGDVSLTARPLPTAVFALGGVGTLGVGGTHTCAGMKDGSARCWGRNAEGQLGDTTNTQRTSPVVSAGVGEVVSIQGGNTHTCAMLKSGYARCWGNNAAGQLGNETTFNSNAASWVVNLPCGGGGSSETCKTCAPLTCQKAGKTNGVIDDGCGGTLWCGVPADTMVGGTHFGCTLAKDGKVMCWGRNNFGQLGNGNSTDTSTAVAVGKLTDAVSLTAGNGHACAVTAAGTVWCWGSNSNGQLGTGGVDGNPHSTPEQVAGLTNAVRVSAGRLHTCAVLADGTARCWGLNSNGQLGDGTTTQRALPTQVVDIGGLVDIAGHYASTCALTQTGLVRCWGLNDNGQIGNGYVSQLRPMNVYALSGVRTLAQASTSYHQCVTLASGALRCWGNNDAGQLGDNTAADRPYPVQPVGITTAKSISGGFRHSCAVLTDGTARCWGRNAEGQLGDGTTAQRNAPVGVALMSGAVAVGGQYYASCFQLATGAVKCSGYNAFGGLGDKTLVNKTSAVSVTGLP